MTDGTPHRENVAKYADKQLYVGSDMSNAEFELIREILFEGRGFDLDGYKDRCIKRRIAARMRSLGYRTAEDYVLRLRGDNLELDQLIETLTIHVSQFFRNLSTFSVIEEEILPELLEKRREKGEVRVWSVGCAGGEEPYSIALLCDELCGPDDRVSILGTDISGEVLKRAREGLYLAHRLAEVPQEVLARYFVPEGGSYRLSAGIRSRVRFFRHDILQDRPFHRVDLILCRNMLIYFSRQEQEKILRSLATALLPGGVLVLGRAENMVSESRDLFSCINPAERIYRKL